MRFCRKTSRLGSYVLERNTKILNSYIEEKGEDVYVCNSFEKTSWLGSYVLERNAKILNSYIEERGEDYQVVQVVCLVRPNYDLKWRRSTAFISPSHSETACRHRLITYWVIPTAFPWDWWFIGVTAIVDCRALIINASVCAFASLDQEVRLTTPSLWIDIQFSFSQWLEACIDPFSVHLRVLASRDLVRFSDTRICTILSAKYVAIHQRAWVA